MRPTLWFFPGGVLQEEDNSVTESSSSSWQWLWAASGEIKYVEPSPWCDG